MSPKKRRQSHASNTRNILIGRKPVTIEGEEVVPTRYLPNNRVVTSKYTLLNFLPKNLFEQFRRLANFYFLCIAVIQVTTNSPVSPITSLAPLMFVVTTTALKQGYEDWLRHRTDRQTNRRMFPVLVNDKLRDLRSEVIRVGDVVMVKGNEEIPCDMVLVSCHSSQGRCHVTTANLDGETNLKVRDCLPATKDLKTEESLKSLTGIIQCEKPNTDLYEFVGNFKLVQETNVQTFPLSSSNLLVRGSRLQNCPFVYGIAVYTGPETKMALNSRVTSSKFSSVEKAANKYLVTYLMLLVIFAGTATIVRMLLQDDPVMGTPWYIEPLILKDKTISMFFVINEFLAFFVIFNYIIPISLYVTLETVKFFGSKTLVSDSSLIDPTNPDKPKCNSSDLNEELGQVEYLFSDKTGTLTDNMMRFRTCFIDGMPLEEQNGKLVPQKSHNIDQTKMEEFFTAINICNTIQVRSEPESQKLHYSADSPDEKSLVEAAGLFGVLLVEATEQQCQVHVQSSNKTTTYKKLQTFEFDSARKRMSVIVQDEAGKIFMVCKGAESEVSPLVVSGKIDETLKEVDEYARQGLRTLIIATRNLSKDEYDSIARDIDEASKKMDNRKDHVRKVQIKAEKKLHLLGATAVEDKLQDGVPETIRDLKLAGIKVWILTGDKMETAVSVAFSCQLLDENVTQMILSRQPDADACGESLNRFLTVVNEPDPQSTSNAKYGLVVDGRSLHLASKFHYDKLLQVCLSCAVVLCCRMSPIQKAQVVRMIKNSEGSPVTGAIGDGANDVSMIQEAHVGFGLMGKEGRQAVNSADFAFSRFRFLRTVLLIHGHLFYMRVSNLIHYFFYKNVIFVTPQVIYSYFNAFSSQTIYHGLLLMLYNMMFTATPILVYGIEERHLPIEVLDSDPSLYRLISRNRNMHPKEFCSWFFNGVFHGVVIYCIFHILWAESILPSGHNLGLFAFGLIVYHGVVITANLKLAILTRYWSIYFFLSLILSILALIGFLAAYSNFKWRILNDDLFGIYHEFLSSSSFWLSFIICPFITLLPDFVYTIMKHTIKEIRTNNRIRAN